MSKKGNRRYPIFKKVLFIFSAETSQMALFSVTHRAPQANLRRQQIQKLKIYYK